MSSHAANLDFHADILRSVVLDSIEAGEINRAVEGYAQLTALHYKPQVASTLLPLGLLLIKLNQPAHLVKTQNKILLRNLIALKGPCLFTHVKCLAEFHLSENNTAEAEALVKSKLHFNNSRKLLIALKLV